MSSDQAIKGKGGEWIQWVSGMTSVGGLSANAIIQSVLSEELKKSPSLLQLTEFLSTVASKSGDPDQMVFHTICADDEFRNQIDLIDSIRVS